MKHSKQYDRLGGGYRKRRIYGWTIAGLVVIIVLLALAYNGKAATIDYQQTHKCIEAYKAMNQTGWKPLHDVAQCTHNPYIIT